jgi:iron complex outermembrane recepter protein
MRRILVSIGLLMPILTWSQVQDTVKHITPVGSPVAMGDFAIEDKVLATVPVVGFLEGRMSRDVPAPIQVVGKDVFGSTDQTSLINAMNSVPGVMMESRGAGGSHRISIRGSALRAPFAVRNIKMYVNGIAFTSPDGQSPLEVMDASDLNSIEVMRGPSGSLWGSGNGGVLQFNLVQPSLLAKGGFIARSEAQAGSFEQYRMNHSIQTGGNKWSMRFSQTSQSVSGYREQEFNRKNSSVLFARLRPNNDQILDIVGLYYNGNWGLPGGLNMEQRDTSRTSAIPYSLENNASVWRNRKMLGVGHTWWYKGKWKFRNTMNFYDTQKKNPFGTSAFRNGYKDESAAGGGVRTEVTRSFKMLRAQHRFVVGGEAQMEHYFINEASNLQGTPGDFKYMYNVNYANYNVFGLLEMNFWQFIHLQAGGSLLQETQQVSGFTAGGWQTDTTHRSELMILPRVALSLDLSETWKLFGSYGHGNSMPTIFEMVDYTKNQYNLNLQPEQGINREAGIKYANPTKERSFETNVYYTNIRGIILSTPTMVEAPGGGGMVEVDLFTNSGTTAQKGIECSGQWTKYFNATRIKLQWQSSGSWSLYRFIDYKVGDQNYVDRRLPGVPTVQWFNHLRLTYLKNYSIGTMVQYMGPIDLNYANTVRSTDYTIVNVYASAAKSLGSHFTLGVRAGVNNATDVRYSGFFNYNDFNNRYYNPALPINYFALLSLEYSLMK